MGTRRRARRRRPDVLTPGVKYWLATGYWWAFVAEDGEACPEESERRALLAEHEDAIREWAASEHAGCRLWADRGAEIGQLEGQENRTDGTNGTNAEIGPGPLSRAGWQPYLDSEVRADWAAGEWAYALGRPAWEHGRYAEAVGIAAGEFDRKERKEHKEETQERAWNPWWIRTWQDVEAVLAGCWFDWRRAMRPVVFFEWFVKHDKGQMAGRPFVLMDWLQWDITMPLFGWVTRNQDGLVVRSHTRAYIEVPKKQSKSAWSSGVSLYMLVADDEMGPEVYSAATSQKQAGIIHQTSVHMVKQSPELREVLDCVDHIKTIRYDRAMGWFRALSSDADTSEGLHFHAAIVDELHAHRSRRLWGSLVHGGAARIQPLFAAITTAGKYSPASIGWEQHAVAERIMRGTQVSIHFLAYIACANDEMDAADPATWKRANPSYGVTITQENFAQMWAEAQGDPAAVHDFLRYRLNRWVQTVGAWIDFRAWDQCGGEIDFAALERRPCYGGLDLSATTDLTAWALVWPPWGGDPLWRLRVRTWVPEATMRMRVATYDVPYDAWVVDGWLELTDGNSVDYDTIRAAVVADSQRWKPREVGYDPWNATQLATQLSGQDGIVMVEVRQGGRTLNEPTRLMQTLVLDGRLVHGGNPALTWAMGNLVVREDSNGNVTPDKSKSTEKIDPAVAVIIAMSRAIANAGAGTGRSRYSDEGAEMVWVDSPFG